MYAAVALESKRKKAGIYERKSIKHKEDA